MRTGAAHLYEHTLQNRSDAYDLFAGQRANFLDFTVLEDGKALPIRTQPAGTHINTQRYFDCEMQAGQTFDFWLPDVPGPRPSGHPGPDVPGPGAPTNVTDPDHTDDDSSNTFSYRKTHGFRNTYRPTSEFRPPRWPHKGLRYSFNTVIPY